jgi:uncharacterized protein YeaO (DUF488 family)
MVGRERVDERFAGVCLCLRSISNIGAKMIKTKSVYSPIDRRRDGLRILATRVRGRDLRATRYDVWMANLAPSERLLNDVRADKVTWSEFSRRYRQESERPDYKFTW